MPVGIGLAAKGDPVGIVIGQAGQELVQRARVPDLVLRDRAGCHVLLQHRRDAGPLGVPEADHELVVSDAQDQLSERLAGGGIEGHGRLGNHSSVSVARAFAASSLCLMR